MKVGILTWYKAVNHGAVLQTYASCKMLEKLSCDPVVLDYDWNLENISERNYIEILRKLSIKKVLWKVNVKKFLRTKKQIFSDFRKQYLPLGKKYYDEHELDAVYIGSDMVFDISEGYNPFMYGIGVDSKYIFSYAASFGYTTIEKLQSSKYETEIVEGIKKLKSIGYRDSNTLEIIEHYKVNVSTVECLDPVLCYGFEDEIIIWDSGKWKKEKYILVYAYESTMNDKSTVKAIKTFAKEEKLKIVSCGYYHKWCDKCVQASPREFLEMFKHASYIITDTFHGTVFSLILHKSFVSIVRNNGFKLKYLLETVKLTDRIVKKPEDIERVISSKLSFTRFDEWVEENRKKSLDFIAFNIEGVKKHES